ncbi:MAG: NUDIX domain-containing protein [bacterium]|nr:NUDIX domain-containing protein [bacterium]
MRHGASVILIRKEDGAVLMQHRSDDPAISYPDFWAYPGGAVEDEDGNNFEKAAKRELYEETGYTIAGGGLYLLTETDFTRSDGRVLRNHIFWAIYDGKQEIVTGEGVEMKFLTKEDFKGEKIVPGEEEFSRLALERAKLNGLVDEIQPKFGRIKIA